MLLAYGVFFLEKVLFQNMVLENASIKYYDFRLFALVLERPNMEHNFNGDRNAS